MTEHFLCVHCGELTDKCKCDHSSTGVFIETELAFRRKVMDKLASIQTKVDQLLDLTKRPRTIVIQGFDDDD